MEIRKKLIQEIVTEESFPFLLDMNELMPDILIEIRARLFEKNIKFPADWKEYRMVRDGENLHITTDKYLNNRYFRFSIYIGNKDQRLYYGITGPWDFNNKTELLNLSNIAVAAGFTRWTNWAYKYFSVSMETFYSSIRNNQNLEIVMAPLLDEFFNSCSAFRESLETANENLYIK
jgi:hypothetical protein